jgi:hypothetical protein
MMLPFSTGSISDRLCRTIFEHITTGYAICLFGEGILYKNYTYFNFDTYVEREIQINSVCLPNSFDDYVGPEKVVMVNIKLRSRFGTATSCEDHVSLLKANVFRSGQ